MERRVSKAKQEEGGLFYDKPSSLVFIPSGCTVLDCVLGGGWPLGRMSNVIGDNSAGKTLLAIEGSANAAMRFPEGKIWYREAESAFDQPYAESLGLPLDRVDFGEPGQWNTVEDIEADLAACAKERRPIYQKWLTAFERAQNRKREFDEPPPGGLYIIDSMDALSDKAETKRDIDEASFALTKQKKLHELFRRLVREIGQAGIHLMIISQSRAKITPGFGDRTTRSGGAALDFYASQHLKLAKLGQISKKIKDQKHVTGVSIHAKCTKNKIGLAHRECDFDIKFMFGINDAAACLKYLKDHGELKEAGLTIATADKLESFLQNLDKESHADWGRELSRAVRAAWPRVQAKAMPTWKKY